MKAAGLLIHLRNIWIDKLFVHILLLCRKKFLHKLYISLLVLLRNIFLRQILIWDGKCEYLCQHEYIIGLVHNLKAL